MAKDNNYNDLVSLKGPDQVRLRPAVIFGSDSVEGCRHSVFEIISNSIDEAREGYGKSITITLHADKSVTVEDHGRGIPIDYNKTEEKYNWELAFCTLYAGGKYYVIYDWQSARSSFNNTDITVVLAELDPTIDFAGAEVTVVFEARDGGRHNGVGEACKLHDFQTLYN